jgi:glyoxylase-like metal-dependent hydrolase (beta-lactamase superfamily II)
MSTSPLSIDVYVAPMRPYTCPDQLGEGEVATWAPSSSTLISGPTEGILVDALLTFEDADQIAAWAKSFGKKITGVYITHGHSDHWLGLARLLQHFPEARGYAAPEVAGRAAWEAKFNKTSKYWTSRFPGELPETPVVPEVLNIDEILVDSQVVNLIHVGQGDIQGSTIAFESTLGYPARLHALVRVRCMANDGPRTEPAASALRSVSTKPEKLTSAILLLSECCGRLLLHTRNAEG